MTYGKPLVGCTPSERSGGCLVMPVVLVLLEHDPGSA